MYDDICKQSKFLEDVKEHNLEIVQDSGVNRHIRFKNPKSGSYWFDLVTWHGRLCISGDCGTYVFTRVTDMFDFFRDGLKDGERLQINPQYWAEKIEATDKDGGHKQWSFNKFKEYVKEEVDTFTEDWSDEEAKRVAIDIRKSVERDVLNNVDNEFSALTAIENFEHDCFEFRDFWEHNCDDWTHGYIWCLYAIVWGIRQYEKEKQKSDCYAASMRILEALPHD